MHTITDLKEYLDQYDDSSPIVIRADTKRELHGVSNRIRIKALTWKEN